MKAYAFALILLGAGAAHAEPAVTTRATDLMAQAQADAAKIASLSENTKVEILRRVGAWSEVKSSSGQGWVRMLSLRPESSGTAASSGASGLGNVVGALTGRTSNSATVTTGVKGLNKEDLANAQSNPEEFKKMQKYAVSKDAGRVFAQRAKLSANNVEYLKGSFAASGNDNNNSGSTPGMTGM